MLLLISVLVVLVSMCCCIGREFHLFPGGVGSWLQMQAGNSEWDGAVSRGSFPIQSEDDDELTELRHANGCTQFY